MAPRRPPASGPARRSPRRPPHKGWTHYAAPAAFLLAETIAILLIRSGLQGAETTTTTRPAATATTPKAKPKPKPTTTTRKTTTGAAQYYTVVAGDTFGTIASKSGTTVAEIERLNPRVKSTSLFIGQRIRVK